MMTEASPFPGDLAERTRYLRWQSRYAPGSALWQFVTFAGVASPGGVGDDPEERARSLAAWVPFESWIVREQLKVEHTEDDMAAVRASTAYFAGSEHWWVRLCVADLVRTFPEFDDGSVLETLTNDPHPSVRETAAEPFWPDVDFRVWYGTPSKTRVF